MHLKPLQHPLEEIENVEFNEVKPLLNCMLHIVCLIWGTSKYYCAPARIIVLLQEICNLLIQQVRREAVLILPVGLFACLSCLETIHLPHGATLDSVQVRRKT